MCSDLSRLVGEQKKTVKEKRFGREGSVYTLLHLATTADIKGKEKKRIVWRGREAHNSHCVCPCVRGACVERGAKGREKKPFPFSDLGKALDYSREEEDRERGAREASIYTTGEKNREKKKVSGTLTNSASIPHKTTLKSTLGG